MFQLGDLTYMYGLQRRRESVMQHAGRRACTAERERVLADAAAVKIDCALADNTVQVTHFLTALGPGPKPWWGVAVLMNTQVCALLETCS